MFRRTLGRTLVALGGAVLPVATHRSLAGHDLPRPLPEMPATALMPQRLLTMIPQVAPVTTVGPDRVSDDGGGRRMPANRSRIQYRTHTILPSGAWSYTVSRTVQLHEAP